MKIRISDIPPEGRELEFDVEPTEMNARLEAAREEPVRGIQGPPFAFSNLPEKTPRAKLRLMLEGRTVLIEGEADGTYRTVCGRCAEEVERPLKIPIQMVLKPHSERSRPDEEVEDLQLGFYDGKEVDCNPIVEELFLLSLPLTTVCSADCKGLCPKCGANLNTNPCNCKSEAGGDDRFALLRQLKVH